MKTQNMIARRDLATSKVGLGLTSLMVAIMLLGLLSVDFAGAAPAIGLPQFQQLWDYSDKPVADGKTSRSFTWGPTVSEVLTEPYTQGNSRKVQYFDKTRMEQTEGRPVTNGLLAKELITGLLQLGDNDFQGYNPSTTINIAGDQVGNVPNPTYFSFRKVATINLDENKATDRTGQTVTATIARDGTTGASADLGTQYNVKNSYFDKTLNHNIADVFWNFLNQNGVVYKNGAFVTDKGFDWLQVVGLPLTEPFWSKSVVAGKTQDVLVQAFERRVLTYTPANPEAFKVEMGNVGQHYYQWRTEVTAPKPTPTPVPPTPTLSNVLPLPAVPAWNNATRLVPSQTVLFGPAMKVRPTDGTAFIVGESGAPDRLLLTNSKDPNNFTNINDASSNGSKRANLAFGPDGTGYIVWRFFNGPVPYLAYMRKMNPDGSFQKGVNLSDLYRAAGGPGEFDLPDLVVSPKTGKLFITGQVKTFNGGRPSWGFAESTNGGASLTGAITVAGPEDTQGEIQPHICIDGDENVHMIGYWRKDLVAISRINGKWTGLTRLTDSAGLDYTFRGLLGIACGADGYAYGAFSSVNAHNDGVSVGLVRYAPGKGWQRMAYDIYGIAKSSKFKSTTGADVTVTPDNRVWVVGGISGGPDSGVLVASSSDRGQTFGNFQVPIRRDQANASAKIASNVFNGQTRLHIMGTFKEPGTRESFYTSTK